MKLKKMIALFLFSAALILTGCEKEGPMEKAGEKMDNVIEDAGDTIEETGDKMGETMEEAGDKVKDATN